MKVFETEKSISFATQRVANEKSNANSFRLLAGQLAKFNKTAKLGDKIVVAFSVVKCMGFKVFGAAKSLPLFSLELNENYTRGYFGYSEDSEIEQHFKINFLTPEDRSSFVDALEAGKNQINLEVEKIIFITKEGLEKVCTSITYLA